MEFKLAASSGSIDVFPGNLFGTGSPVARREDLIPTQGLFLNQCHFSRFRAENHADYQQANTPGQPTTPPKTLIGYS